MKDTNLLFAQDGPPKSNKALSANVLIKSTPHLLAVAPKVAATVYLLLRPPRKLTGLRGGKKKTNEILLTFKCWSSDVNILQPYEGGGAGLITLKNL